MVYVIEWKRLQAIAINYMRLQVMAYKCKGEELIAIEYYRNAIEWAPTSHISQHLNFSSQSCIFRSDSYVLGFAAV